MQEVTAKQERFCQEYLIDLNATQAAIRAGYSERTAQEQSSRLLSNVIVQKRVAELQEAIANRNSVSQDMVVQELKKIGFSDIRKAVRWGRNPLDTTSENASPNGLNMFPVSLVPSEEIDDDTAASVCEVSLTQTGVKIKQYDKISALDKLARHLGMYTDKHELLGRDGGPLSIAVEYVSSKNTDTR